MPHFARPIERAASRLLSATDSLVSRLATWKYNPVYQSGTVVVALFFALLVTGLWLILFYRVGAPWASVAQLTANPWTGNWVRGVHRYASDAAVVATLIHAVRMFSQGRSWGARALAWMSGVVLLGLILVCGWTGYVMVWDTFGQLLAREGARIIDALPVLSEPTSRAFTGERPIPSAFFFLNLFAHIGIPLGLGILFWLHVSRIARPALMPPRQLTWAIIGTLTVVAMAMPLVMAPEANAFVIPSRVPIDPFYVFWLPFTRSQPGGVVLAAGAAAFVALLLVPLVTRPRGANAPAPSSVDEKICVDCVQCSLDCPYDAITMIARSDGRADHVARVDPARCVSCGICAASCAPMGVGPTHRTGRDQLARVRAFIASPARHAGELIVIGCSRGGGRRDDIIAVEGATLYPVDCAGAVHTSVIELLVRAGAGGVLVLSCPPRDCWSREGPKWLLERIRGKREAALQPRVPRERVHVAYAGRYDGGDVRAAIREVRRSIAALGQPPRETDSEVELLCVPVQLPEDA